MRIALLVGGFLNAVTPSSSAQRAYDRVAAGDVAGATVDYDDAKRAYDAVGLVSDRPTVRGALGMLRLEAERDQRKDPGSAPNVDCSVFAKHGADALDAYRAWFASTRDRYGSAVKNQCLDVTLASAAPLDAARARSAKDQIVAAMLREIPIPDGTMYEGMAIGAADAVVDVLLAPEAVATSNGDTALAAAVRKSPASAAAVARFAAVRDAGVPALGTGVCAVLKARGRNEIRANCEKIARSATNYAMASWIDATRDS